MPLIQVKLIENVFTPEQKLVTVKRYSTTPTNNSKGHLTDLIQPITSPDDSELQGAHTL